MNDVPTLTPDKIITTIKNKKTGTVYETEQDLKAANIPDAIVTGKHGYYNKNTQP